MIDAIANHLWQSTLFAGLIGALCLLLSNDAARLRYRLWWLASVKFLIPFSAFPATRAADAQATVLLYADRWSTTAKAVTAPFAENPAAWSPAPLVFVVWGAGSAAVLAFWLVRSLRLRKVLRAATRDPHPATVDGLRLEVYRTRASLEPGVAGLFRPALLLPHDIEDRLSPAQLSAVLAHEIGHVKRRDNLTAAVHMLTEAAFWFHPLVWWIGARLVDERERACDELVVALGHDRATYAESILDVCEHYAVSPLRSAAGISGSDLKRRITQIMRYEGMKSLRLAKKIALGAAAGATLTIALLAGLTIDRSALAQDHVCLETPAFPEPSVAGGDTREGIIELVRDGAYLPIVKVAPLYPPRAAARGLEGYVVVDYTVGRDGSTEDVRVIESSSPLFERAALESATKYRYRPCVVEGVPIAYPGVRTKIVFELEGIDQPAPRGPDTDDDLIIVTGTLPADDAPEEEARQAE